MASEAQRNAEPLRFEVGAGIVLTLGGNLITDSIQAVMELVKNAYDADSSWVSVDVTTTEISQDPNCLGARGYVKVVDNGHGMTLDDVKRGWLTIAQSQKRQMKAEGRRTTGRSRTPLGDKGLGRLGSQALGDYVHIVTRPKGQSEELSVWVDWSEFRDDRILSDVTIRHSSRVRAPDARDGTAITIWGLKDLESWTSAEAKHDLQVQLARLISPFKAIDQFSIAVSLDGNSLDLLDFGQKLRRAAATTFSFRFDGTYLTVDGEAKLAYCRPAPSGTKEREVANARFAAYISSDGGEKLLHRLSKRSSNRLGGMVLERSVRSGWFIKASSTRKLDDLADRLPRVSGSPVSPGPFSGELDTFVFSGQLDLRVPPDLKEAIKQSAGIRVYRDGFGIKLVSDWLGFASHITKGSSYFELKLENTVGYVAITAEHNTQLEETSDRQRFKEDTPAFRVFQRLMQRVISFVGEFQELLRREATAFLMEEASRHANVDPESSVAQVEDGFKAHVAEAKAAKPKVEKQRASLQKLRDRVKTQTDSSTPRAPQLSFLSSDPDPEVVQLLKDIDGAVEETQGVLDAVNGVLARANEVAAMRDLLMERFEVLDRQTVLLHETASLGLNAEVMAHEIAQIANGLLQRATTLLRAARQGNVDTSEVIRFAEHVRSQSNALQQQASHIAPALRYVRDRRDELNVAVVVGEIVKYHAPRLSERRCITLQMKTLVDTPFLVAINQGKLTQVLDNLILNAEYWVAEYLRQGNDTAGTIEIEVETPFLRVGDSGFGVDPAIEDLLFEQPFVTTKKEGRGLGLFLSRRLLESDGCTLTLALDRNERDRRYKFLIDLSGVLRDGN